MKYYFSPFLILLVTSCASAKNPAVSELEIRPGEVRLVEFETEGENFRFFCRDKEQRIQRQGNKLRAVVMESYFTNFSPFSCQLKQDEQMLHEIVVKVVDKEFKAEQLRVNPRRIKLNKKDQKRADAEQLILNKIYASSVDTFLFDQSFKAPLESVITSTYGTKRVYNKQKKGQHLGTDFRAAVGVKVPATNKGKVVFAGDLFYTGGTVIIDHGLDIFSVYGHLSKPLVEAGQVVERGQVIGLSGNTGRTSGPHLHWGVKVQGQYIDGMALIEESKKIFKD